VIQENKEIQDTMCNKLTKDPLGIPPHASVLMGCSGIHAQSHTGVSKPVLPSIVVQIQSDRHGTCVPWGVTKNCSKKMNLTHQEYG
jgi:hypothetical protein